MTAENFDQFRFETTALLFPIEIEQDNWVFFHGTSGQFATRIEKHGLQVEKDVCSQGEVQQVISIFDAIHWVGLHAGGYGVLRAYSCPDFDATGTKRVCLCRYAPTCLLYASREWAGGETARAMRHAIRDLERYVNEPQIEADHRISLLEDERNRPPNAMPEPPKIPAKIEWVRTEIIRLQTVKARLDEVERRHTCGIVYAVRFTRADLPKLTMDRGCPMEVRIPKVSAGQIEAKVEIPNDYISKVSCVDAEYMNRLEEFSRPGSLLFDMKAKGCS